MTVDFLLSILGAIQTTRHLGATALQEIRRRQFTDEERQLLNEAAETGQIRVMDIDQVPAPWIRVEHKKGWRDFLDQENPAVSATFRQAFRSLAERGYIEPVEGQLFSLTGDGFKKARENWPNEGRYEKTSSIEPV